MTGPDRGGGLAWICTWLAVRRAGGRAQRLRPADSQPAPAFDGLILGGGADIAPALYGQAAGPPQPPRDPSLLRWLLALVLYPLFFLLRRIFSTRHYGGLDHGRDALETQLLHEALRSGRPVLGICRGAQLINVACQGDLHQDISGFYTESPQAWSILPVKYVAVADDSHLCAVLRTDRCKVNALHRQSINRLGEGLRISAREPNGIVQAIEKREADFVIGVQWHPEYLPHLRRQQRLFRCLIDRARAYADGTPGSGASGRAHP